MAYLKGMGKTLLDGETQNINGYCLNLCVLAQSGLQDMIKIPLDDRRADTEVVLSAILFLYEWFWNCALTRNLQSHPCCQLIHPYSHRLPSVYPSQTLKFRLNNRSIGRGRYRPLSFAVCLAASETRKS